MRSLTLCAACLRHVYVDEPQCPFCGHAPADTGAKFTKSVSRLAGAAVAMVAATACGGRAAGGNESAPDATETGVDAVAQQDAVGEASSPVDTSLPIEEQAADGSNQSDTSIATDVDAMDASDELDILASPFPPVVIPYRAPARHS